MLYDYTNVHPHTTVVDVEAGKTLDRVLSVDAEAGIVNMTHSPVQVDWLRGIVKTYQFRFARIYSFHDQDKPVMFHCYGRQS